MRLVDEGVVVELVADDLDPDHLGDQELAAPEVWTLRHDVNAYDATYLALAELTGATTLHCAAPTSAAPPRPVSDALSR